jgi:hypothetical protein
MVGQLESVFSTRKLTLSFKSDSDQSEQMILKCFVYQTVSNASTDAADFELRITSIDFSKLRFHRKRWQIQYTRYDRDSEFSCRMYAKPAPPRISISTYWHFQKLVDKSRSGSSIGLSSSRPAVFNE